MNHSNENHITGWIKLFRSLRNHWVWKDEKKLKCWIDIILEVNHKDNKINIGGSLFDCKRGQSIMSLKNWADRWNISKDKARNFLKLLAKDEMITLENLTKTTRITVCNYETYQPDPNASQTQVKRKPNAKSPKQELKKERMKQEYSDFDFVRDEFLDLWIDEFIPLKEKKKASITDRAIKSGLNKIKTLSNNDYGLALKILEKSVDSGWVDFYEIKGVKPIKKEMTIIKHIPIPFIDCPNADPELPDWKTRVGGMK